MKALIRAFLRSWPNSFWSFLWKARGEAMISKPRQTAPGPLQQRLQNFRTCPAVHVRYMPVYTLDDTVVHLVKAQCHA